MRTKKEVAQIGALLAQGGIGQVRFKKKSGEMRDMNFQRNVQVGLQGGKWANGNAGKPTDHHLVTVLDNGLYRENLTKFELDGMDAENAKIEAARKSRRAFKIDSVVKLSMGGETLDFS